MPRLVFFLWTRLKNVGESSINLAKYMNFSSLIATPWLFENNCFQVHILLFRHGSTNRLARCSSTRNHWSVSYMLVPPSCPTHDGLTHRTWTLRVGVAREWLFLHVHYFFMDINGHKNAISEGVSKILSNFEIIMSFWRFGQTIVDQSLWIYIAYETLS